MKSRAVNIVPALQRSAINQHLWLWVRRSHLHKRQQPQQPAQWCLFHLKEFVSLFSPTWIIILHHTGHEYVERHLVFEIFQLPWAQRGALPAAECLLVCVWFTFMHTNKNKKGESHDKERLNVLNCLQHTCEGNTASPGDGSWWHTCRFIFHIQC